MKRKAGNACEGWGLERGPKGLLHRVKDVLPCMRVLAQGGCVKVELSYEPCRGIVCTQTRGWQRRYLD